MNDLLWLVGLTLTVVGIAGFAFRFWQFWHIDFLANRSIELVKGIFDAHGFKRIEDEKYKFIGKHMKVDIKFGIGKGCFKVEVNDSLEHIVAGRGYFKLLRIWKELNARLPQ